jgi:phospholipase C
MGEGPGKGAHPDRRRRKRLWTVAAIAATGFLGASAAVGVSVASASSPAGHTANSAGVPKTAPARDYRVVAPTSTPIKHVVVLFDENVSFDHYFGTYPKAANTDGSPFRAQRGTPKVNGLTPKLLNHNPNEYNPQRLSPDQALTCDQNHSYAPEQKADDNGAMDAFVQNTSVDTCTGQPVLYGAPGLGMDYYDGNTVTGLWNYAQHYAMSDNNYGTNFGPSTPGAVNLISGNDGGASAVDPTTGQPVADSSIGSLDKNGLGTMFGDMDPAYDDCSDTNHTASNPLGILTGQNIGDLLNTKHVTWGWFQGGFVPTGKTSAGFSQCTAAHENIGGVPVTDYVAHHEPFQFYASTANPKHLPPSSEAEIGRTDQANHQYGLSAFYSTLRYGNMPAVSFLKPPAYQNGHAANSDPTDEQRFITTTVNQIEKSKFWKSTAIVITYDDSDGWYDHQKAPTVNGSNDSALDTALCSSVHVKLGNRNDRCGYGPRLPLVVISPYTRTNYVSHQLTDQSSVINFIEDNWLHGQRLGQGSFDTVAGNLAGRNGLLDFQVRPHDARIILNPTTGEVVHQRHRR